MNSSLSTLIYLKKIINKEDWKTAEYVLPDFCIFRELLSLLKRSGKNLLGNSYENVPVHNAIQRLIKVVKEEALSLHPKADSLQKRRQMVNVFAYIYADRLLRWMRLMSISLVLLENSLLTV